MDQLSLLNLHMYMHLHSSEGIYKYYLSLFVGLILLFRKYSVYQNWTLMDLRYLTVKPSRRFDMTFCMTITVFLLKKEKV